jgi:hypothetical protein
MLQCNELFLFKGWVYSATLEDFRGKDVLESGCGGGKVPCNMENHDIPAAQ